MDVLIYLACVTLIAGMFFRAYQRQQDALYGSGLTDEQLDEVHRRQMAKWPELREHAISLMHDHPDIDGRWHAAKADGSCCFPPPEGEVEDG